MIVTLLFVPWLTPADVLFKVAVLNCSDRKIDINLMFLKMGTKVEQLLLRVIESKPVTLSTLPHSLQSFEAHL